MNILATIGRPFVKSYFKIGDFGKFFIFQIMLFPKFLKPPFRIKLILKHIESMGVMSLGVVSLTGLFTGMVLAIQMYFGFHKFGAESVMGFTIFYSVGRELGPVFTTLMLISKAVSAMSAELGTMRVTEQIDAIDILSIDSKKYLIVPRIIAMVFATPLLILVFDMIANIGAYVMAVHALDVNPTSLLAVLAASIAEFPPPMIIVFLPKFTILFCLTLLKKDN